MWTQVEPDLNTPPRYVGVYIGWDYFETKDLSKRWCCLLQIYNSGEVYEFYLKCTFVFTFKEPSLNDTGKTHK